MNKKYFMVCFLVVVSLVLQAQADTVIRRYRNYLLENVPYDPALIQTWMASFDPLKQWPDIAYNDQERANWQVSQHLERIRDMAVAWESPKSPAYQQEKLWLTINAALNHWLKMRYQNSNWWHNQIGVPQYMRDIITLLRDRLSEVQLKGSLEVMGQFRVQQNGAGANLVWSANLGLHYGVLTNNLELMRRCRDLLLNEIRLTTKDGIQPDFSFHQHEQRLQMYQYGSAFLWENIRIAWLLRGTSLAYPDEKLNLLKDLIVKGWQWMARGIHTVPGTVDRSVSRIDALNSADIRKLIPYMGDLWPQDKQQFQRIEEIQNGTAALMGYRYYPYSDFAAYHQKDFSFFLKTLSTRTLPTESINSENLKGHLLHSGDAYLIRDGEEYCNLMPVWDWEHLPGVTSFKSAYKMDRQPFVGGVSNGETGCSVMDYLLQDSEHQQALSAHKFWASHDNLVVCLIAGLETRNTDEEVFTTLDQCRWKGNVIVNQPGTVLTEGDHTIEQVQWIYHSGLAYIPLRPGRMEVHVNSVSGSWKSINASLSDVPVTEKVFTPIMVHGRQLKDVATGYVLACCATARQAQLLARNPNWKIVRNDRECQAVSFKDGATMIAFYQPGTVTLADKKRLAADRPCLILVADHKLYASDPRQAGGRLIIELNGKKRILQLPDHGLSTGGLELD